MVSKLICNKNQILSLYLRRFSISSCFYTNHYNILNLNRNCSQADIRNSYLKLSKKYHPDKNKDENTHKKFVNISEAYNILSKPASRRAYDLGLINGNPNVHVRTARSSVRTDQTIWEHRDTSKDSFYRSKPYYGIKGLKKISNICVVLICIGVTSFGILLQILAIRKSFTLRRDEMAKRSSDFEQMHSEIRARALENGDKKQLELLMERLKNNKSTK